MLELLTTPNRLKRHVIKVLEKRNRKESFLPDIKDNSLLASSVLFLLGMYDVNGNRPEPCLILNKRSVRVKQSGDLCCPGGSMSLKIDRTMGKVLRFPFSPLVRWPYWQRWKIKRPKEAHWLNLLLATSLRESFEEMRLNPLMVNFLGPLPSQRLRMFKREIFPMTGWVTCQKRFFPNWEVEKIVCIPLRAFLNRTAYARYRIFYPCRLKRKFKRKFDEFPCFIHQTSGETEILWGVTYQIVVIFLSTVLNFKPPCAELLPVIPGTLEENYVTGNNGNRQY